MAEGLYEQQRAYKETELPNGIKEISGGMTIPPA